MRSFTLVSAFLLLWATTVLAQDPQTTYCTFADSNEVSVQYNSAVKEQPRNGKVWSPGVTLFVQTPLVIGGSEVGLGAYSVHLIPDKKAWTIVVNKNVTPGTPYNPAQDVAHAPMEIGEIPEAVKTLQLSFGHMAPKQCTLRVYYQKIGAFADFMEK
jgi:hypothetical protein